MPGENRSPQHQSQHQLNRSWKRLQPFGAGLFWVMLWWGCAALINRPLFFPSPPDVLHHLIALFPEPSFYRRTLFTFVHLSLGLLFGMSGGIVLGWISASQMAVRALLAPLIQMMKAVPVASLVIFALFLLPADQLSILVVCLLVLPIFYESAREGRMAADPDLMEMADAFHMRSDLRRKTIVFPAALPFLSAALRSSAGMSWKAGVAAEMIALSSNSIGEALYHSKVTLDLAELVAWTLWLLFVSAALQWLMMRAWDAVWRRMVTPFRRPFRCTSRCAFWHAVQHSLRHLFQRSFRCKSRRVPEPQKRAGEALDSAFRIRLSSGTVHFDASDVMLPAMDIRPGTRLALRGASGGGKTTCFRVLLGFETMDPAPEREGTPRISMLFQENRLIEALSASENLRLVGIRPEQIAEGMEALDLGDAASLPVRELSGGMRQRVALLRAVLAPSDLVLLDEPFTGLDEERRTRSIQWILRTIRPEQGLVIATHRGADAEDLRLGTVWIGAKK